MPSDVRDEVDPDSAGAAVLRISVQAQGPQVTLELPFQERRRLAAPCVASSLRAHQYQCIVLA